jgi:hypothetical protein
MLVRRTPLPERNGERGQTLIFVAVALVSLLGIAALAIDVVTLYVAKSEAQRAADAAALAGANAFVSTGDTTYPPGTYIGLDTLASTMASAFITASLAQNNVSGSPPLLVGTPTIDTSRPGNPHITVTVQQTNLPIFFARIWGNTSASVQATATAEAYNSSSSQIIIGSYIPVSTRCVKPILVLNKDPSGNVFVSTSNGGVNQPPLLPTAGYIGQLIPFASACGGTAGTCTPTFALPAGAVGYVPAVIPAGVFSSGGVNGPYNSTVCPGDCSTNLGGSTYQQSIACCDTTPYNFNQCGIIGTALPLYYDTSNNPDFPTSQTRSGLQCVTHTSAGLLPDTLNPSTFPAGPFQIQPGAYTQTALGITATTYISTSDSIVTLPIIGTNIVGITGPTVIVLGFLQVFIANVPSTTAGADFDAYILNVIGCGTGATAGSVSGGGVSPVPVRLITPP